MDLSVPPLTLTQKLLKQRHLTESAISKMLNHKMYNIKPTTTRQPPFWTVFQSAMVYTHATCNLDQYILSGIMQLVKMHILYALEHQSFRLFNDGKYDSIVSILKECHHNHGEKKVQLYYDFVSVCPNGTSTTVS